MLLLVHKYRQSTLVRLQLHNMVPPHAQHHHCPPPTTSVFASAKFATFAPVLPDAMPPTDAVLSPAKVLLVAVDFMSAEPVREIAALLPSSPAWALVEEMPACVVAVKVVTAVSLASEDPCALASATPIGALALCSKADSQLICTTMKAREGVGSERAG